MLTTSRPIPLEDVLTQVLESKIPNTRDCRLVRRVLGWDGQRGCGLKDAGDEFGITRERARQIYDQAIRQIGSADVGTTLDEALALVNRTSGRAAADIEDELLRRRFTRYQFAIPALVKTAQVFARVPEFTLEEAAGKLFVVAAAGVIQSIIKAARQASTQHGVQNISGLCSAISGIQRHGNHRLLIRQVLNAGGDVRWLDAGEETFWLASVPRNPMVRCLKKVLCYASPVTLSDLHRAIGRLPPKHRATLTRPQLTRFCEQLPFCRVANGCVERVGPLPAGSLISDAERLVCRILQRNGNDLPVERLRSLSALAGVGRPNFWRIALHSPLIFRRAPGSYGVIAASPHPLGAVKGRTA
ncbi:MAG TPA: hypothetical protein VK708_21975 [Bryobacteraceae bacterium]|nr:hypothetical protein [Bryobacteraceae bacterium]